MEPFVAAVTAVIVVFINDVHNTIPRTSKPVTSNTGMTALQSSFNVEKVTFEQWVKNCQLSGTPDTASEEVLDLLIEFKEQAENYSYDIASSFTTGRYTSRLNYRAGGLEELAEMLRLLKKLNKALQKIAASSPPPAYDYAANGNARPLAPMFGGETIDSPGREAETPVWKDAESSAGLKMASQRNEPIPDIHSLWIACSRAFTAMSTYAPSNHHKFQTMRDRLLLWGAGLFRPNGLDLRVLTNRSSFAQDRLAAPLASHLIDICMEQIKLIETWLERSSETLRGHSELRDAALRTRTLLVTTDMAPSLLEEMLHRAFDDKKNGGSSLSNLTEASVIYLHGMVEILFSYLPAVNNQRRLQILDAEAAGVSPPATWTATDAHGSHPEVVSPTERDHRKMAMLIDKNLQAVHEIEDILKNLGEDSEYRDMTAATYASILSKERMRFEEWRDHDYERQINQSTRRELMKVQERLNVKLSSLTRGQTSVTSPTSKRDYPSVKGEKKAMLSEAEIEDVVKSLHSSTTHLYSVE